VIWIALLTRKCGN